VIQALYTETVKMMDSMLKCPKKRGWIKYATRSGERKRKSEQEGSESE
jgi:hypothetical protein